MSFVVRWPLSGESNIDFLDNRVINTHKAYLLTFELKQEVAMYFFETHVEGCTPADPCTNCRATSFLRNKFTQQGFDEFVSILRPTASKTPPAPDKIPLDTKLSDIPRFEGISVRTLNCLKNENIVTLQDLTDKTEGELLRTPNFGRKSLNELKEVLAEFGYSFRTIPLT